MAKHSGKATQKQRGNRIMSEAAIVVVALLAVFLIAYPKGVAHAIFNRAQLSRLQEEIQPSLYLKSLALRPNDWHIRWQTGVVLALTGDLEEAAEVLSSLAAKELPDPQVTKQVFNVMVAGNYKEEALEAYLALDPSPPVSSEVAATFLDNYLSNSKPALTNQAQQLILRVFGLNPNAPEVISLQKKLSDDNLWETDFGRNLWETLKWRTQKQTEGETGVLVTGDQCNVIASMLDLAPDSVSLGPNLIDNGGFERQNFVEGEPWGWRYGFASTGDPWNIGAFVVGPDYNKPFAGKRSLHIDGLYVEWLSERERARAGVQYVPLQVKPGMPYAISFVYRTENAVDGTASLWLSDDPKVLFREDRFLPSTQGKWKQVTIIAWNRSQDEATIAPLLRVWREGSVWFDDFSIRMIHLSSPMSPRPPLRRMDDIK
jgi:hypothetical protein